MGCLWVHCPDTPPRPEHSVLMAVFFCSSLLRDTWPQDAGWQVSAPDTTYCRLPLPSQHVSKVLLPPTKPGSGIVDRRRWCGVGHRWPRCSVGDCRCSIRRREPWRGVGYDTSCCWVGHWNTVCWNWLCILLSDLVCKRFLCVLHRSMLNGILHRSLRSVLDGWHHPDRTAVAILIHMGRMRGASAGCAASTTACGAT